MFPSGSAAWTVKLVILVSKKLNIDVFIVEVNNRVCAFWDLSIKNVFSGVDAVTPSATILTINWETVMFVGFDTS